MQCLDMNWEFPLTRHDKMQRLLMLFEDEVQTAEVDSSELRQENARLRDEVSALRQQLTSVLQTATKNGLSGEQPVTMIEEALPWATMKMPDATAEDDGFFHPAKRKIKDETQQPKQMFVEPTLHLEEQAGARSDLTWLGKLASVQAGFMEEDCSDATHPAVPKGSRTCQRVVQADEEQAMLESLRGVTYELRVVRPETAGGRAAGRCVKLKLKALMLVGDAQTISAAKLLGRFASREPAHLSFAGQVLPSEMPLHFAGIGDGDTLFLVADPGGGAFHRNDSDSEADSDVDSWDRAVLRWAGKY